MKMNVAELIEKLQKFPQDAKVVTCEPYGDQEVPVDLVKLNQDGEVLITQAT